jgi:hypothetical protein
VIGDRVVICELEHADVREHFCDEMEEDVSTSHARGKVAQAREAEYDGELRVSAERDTSIRENEARLQ